MRHFWFIGFLWSRVCYLPDSLEVLAKGLDCYFLANKAVQF